jgi:hypothetical protein
MIVGSPASCRLERRCEPLLDDRPVEREVMGQFAVD